MNYLENEFERIKLEIFGKSDIEYVLENFLLIITKHFKAKQITLDQLKEISLGYPDSFSSIEEYSENFIHAQDNYRILIMDASSENAFLKDEEKKYNLLIISVNDFKIKNVIKCFMKMIKYYNM